MSNNQVQEPNKMSAEAVECLGLARAIAAPRGPDDSVKEMVRRVQRRTGLSWSKSRRFWYGLIREPKARDVDLLRRTAAERARKYTDMLRAMEEMANASSDPDFYRAHVETFRAALVQFGSLPDRARAPAGSAGTED